MDALCKDVGERRSRRKQFGSRAKAARRATQDVPSEVPKGITVLLESYKISCLGAFVERIVLSS
jgi:hypothetical protein